MASPSQLAANRQNALRSSGPKTAQGKRRSAVNATRHGLTAPIATSFWAAQLPAVVATLMADGLSPPQAHALALCILDYERNLQHQRHRYLSSMAPGAAAEPERDMGLALLAHMPARGSPIPGVSRAAAKSSARFLLRLGNRKLRDAEREQHNADRHLRRAANQLLKQCRV